jgi:NTE family protein
MKIARPLPRVGLVLGGGGARGWAHIGVLRAMAERKIQIHAYAGTSIGSLVGGFAAAGKLPALEAVLADMDLKGIIQLFAEKKLPRSGLVDGRHIVELIREQLGNLKIEQLPVPYAAVATDAETGSPVVLNRGDLVTAIRASISIPGMFTPVLRNGRYLVDGGLVNPLPVDLLKNHGLDAIIAVNLHGDGMKPFVREGKQSKKGKGKKTSTHELSTPEKTLQWFEQQKDKLGVTVRSTMQRWLSITDGPNIFQVMTNTVDIVSSHLTTLQLRDVPPDLLIEPRVGSIGHLEFNRIDEGIAAGYKAASSALDDWLKVSG